MIVMDDDGAKNHPPRSGGFKSITVSSLHHARHPNKTVSKTDVIKSSPVQKSNQRTKHNK